MNNHVLDEEAIFHLARKIPDLEAQAEYLFQICAGDHALRERVEALLEVHEQEKDFLKSSLEPAPTANHPTLTERPGTTIGRYKLMEQIGEGGMGIVFVAEQEHPIRRKVAMKVIKPGMDSKAVIARFEAERQALAMMDHSNIAKVLDAGATETGRPYFAMELVKGIPITEYCDKNRLSIRQRIELFVQVCQAIHHAHQKGIIHRDIKPSNVLVTLHDGTPVPKVIDFGVAKALNTRLTDKTIYTEHLQIIGTLLYMSPEQAELSGLDVDTRSDVYSLGVLLYELLTGTTPFLKTKLDEAALDEQRRIIREEDPPRASVRISSLKETATTVAEHRQTDVKKLHQTVCGDLDWIVARALEKDRTRRYDSANGFAADLARYLENEPVVARPPSVGYRLRKFASRNKVTIAAVAVVAICLVSATVVSSWQAMRASRLADQYRQVVEDLQAEIVAIALHAAFRGSADEARKAIVRAELAGAPSDLLQTLRGVALLMEGDTPEAVRILEKAKLENPESVKADAALFWAYWQGASYGKMDYTRDRLRSRSWSDDDYDNLFLAIVHQAAGKPARLRDMDRQLSQLIERHPQWGIAFSLRSSNAMELGMESKEISDFHRAIGDLERAQQLIPGSPFVESEGLYVLISAIELARYQQVDCLPWLDHAASLASSLERSPKCLSGQERLAEYYYLIGETEKAQKIESALVHLGVCESSPMWARMFMQRKVKELEETLRSKPDDIDARLCLGLTLAEQSKDGRQKASRIFDEVLRKELPFTYYCVALDIPMFLGDMEKASGAARRIPESRRWTQWRWWDYVAEFYAGEISESELLDRAGPFSNSGCVAYYAIGMKSLANGERAKAIEYFSKTRNTRKVAWSPYHWGKAFAARLEADEKWPEWIPRDEADE